MATYTELRGLFGNGDLINKVTVAIVIAADAVLDEVTQVATRRDWAEAAMKDPGSEALTMWRYVLAANESAAVASIISAGDALILSNVNAAINKRFGAAV